ncbi:MAG: uracil-DNA glycosylase family protein [Tannerellaceae bacterium]|nr:uracil-DNA glycosylase family protein [Tannerellaceae bacterium]MCD8262908.1 uracil-DNA glycosylase family protein [Tannerellaceae bacterium]
MTLQEKPTELHPLGYFLPENTRLLMLGSFPPARQRWSMNFYYPNIQNDMWRIMGLLFYNDKDHFIIPGKKAFSEEKARAFCIEKGIGIGDTAEEIIRLKDNASDKFLEVVKPLDAQRVFNQIPHCTAVVITGQKAMDTFLSVVPATEPKVGEYTTFLFGGREMQLYRIPSSSRAYPRPLEEKAGYYGKMFREIGLL